MACAGAILIASLSWAYKKTRGDMSERKAHRIQCALLLSTLLLVLPILPALNLNALNPSDFMHGRYAYLSCAGLMMLVAIGWHLAGNLRTLLLLPISLLAVMLAVLTLSQETAWKDNLSVFASGNQIAPQNHQVAINLTRARVEVALPLVDEGRCAEAIPVFEQATKQLPDDWVGWAALGNCFDQLNELPKAEQFLRRAAELTRQPRVAEEWQDVLRRMQEANAIHP
jgi:tetratricopeptide (TPR) repeat protein